MMLLNIASIFGVRLLGSIIVVCVFHVGLNGLWVVLASELLFRGILIYAKFAHGGWKRVVV